MAIREPPRTVKPRKPSRASLPIIAVAGTSVLIERTGETTTTNDLPDLLRIEPSSILVAHNVALTVWELDKAYDGDPRWQFRMFPVEREVYHPDGRRHRTIVKNVVVSFCGFMGMKEPRIASHYHYPLDPLVFVNKTARQIRADTDESLLVALYEWARDVRGFLLDNDLAVRPTSGGLAGQLLRDKRWFPRDRRKVPRATNRRARDYLPGNHYELFSPEDRYIKHAYYLDQENAHHSCAEALSFPHPDTLYAKGRFDGRDRPWLRPSSPRFKQVLREHGLFRLRIHVPHLPDGSFPPPCMSRQGEHTVFVWSNELDDIRALGGRIEYIIAAWTSPDRCTGLTQFATWAINTLKESAPSRKEWLKPALLSTYGVLAAKPRYMEFAYKQATGAELATYPIACEEIEVMTKRAARKHEPGTANVIHRGMVEAETRARSLRLARQLAACGIEVLSVYADSVFARADGPELPLLPHPWKLKSMLNGLRFVNEVSFTSREMNKLPGIPRELQTRFIETRTLGSRKMGTSRNGVRPAGLIDSARLTNRATSPGRKERSNGKGQVRGRAGPNR